MYIPMPKGNCKQPTNSWPKMIHARPQAPGHETLRSSMA